MAWTKLTEVSAGSSDGSTVTTGAIDTTGATFLIAVVSGFGTAPTLSDSKSNSWTALTERGLGSAAEKLFYVVSGTVGSGHTFTANNNFPSVAVIAFSGSHASPFDAETGAGGSSSTLQPGSITPAEDNELLVTGLSWNNANAASINGGFSIATQVAIAGGQHLAVAIAYLIQTTAAAANPTWTVTSGNDLATGMAAFKAAAAGGGSGGARRRRLLFGGR